MIHLDFPRSTDIAQNETLCIPQTLETSIQGLHFIQKGHRKLYFSVGKTKRRLGGSYLKADRTENPDFNITVWNHSPNPLNSSLND